jgi:DNA-binding NtrC family response regulator
MTAKRTLLIVDDESDIVEMLQDLLQDVADEIHTASNGEEALAKVHSHKFDAILSDINMPKMNGLSFLRKLREENIFCPFIILTAHGDKQAAIEALKLSAFDFLEKPWRQAELCAIVEKAIELGQQYNYWESDEAELVEGLQEVKQRNTEAALYRLKKASAKGDT